MNTTSEAAALKNSDRLLRHLEKDSLAAALVHAHENPDGTTPNEAMAAIISARIDAVKEAFDEPKA